MKPQALYIEVTVLFNDQVIQHTNFPLKPIIIGRSNDCDVLLDNAGVSRNHAKIEYLNGQLEVSDLQSGNGTFLNGNSVTQAIIRAGDSLRIGKFTLQIQLTETPSQAPIVNIPPLQNNADIPHNTVFLKPEERQQILQQTPASHAPQPSTNTLTRTLPNHKKQNSWNLLIVGIVIGFLLRSLLELF